MLLSKGKPLLEEQTDEANCSVKLKIYPNLFVHFLDESNREIAEFDVDHSSRPKDSVDGGS